MAKIMIVEDDRNLQSIYGDRLTAEGHTIIAANDGEEALAIAVKEKPDLIISDVMMPKISGFDMLDILRSTPETRNVKIIMMTALSQAEDRERADKLGADKYLVKSQVTLDDVARTVNEIVQGSASVTVPAATTPVPDSATPTAPTAPQPQPTTTATTDDPTNIAVATEPPTTDAVSANDEQAKISKQIDDFLNKNVPVEPVVPASSTPSTTVNNETGDTHPSGATATGSSQGNIQPTGDVNAPKPNIFDLYEKELAKEAEAKTTEPVEPREA